MANPPFLHRPLSENVQLAFAPVDLPTEDSDSQMGSLHSSTTKNIAGKVMPLSYELDQGDAGICALPLESKDECGKCAVYSI